MLGPPSRSQGWVLGEAGEEQAVIIDGTSAELVSQCKAAEKAELKRKRKQDRDTERGNAGEHGVQHLFDYYLGAILSNYWLETLKKLITGSPQTLRADRQTWSQCPWK
ncbi:hypothetical protein PAMP_000810 [Pampus punctatissimus]